MPRATLFVVSTSQSCYLWKASVLFHLIFHLIYIAAHRLLDKMDLLTFFLTGLVFLLTVSWLMTKRGSRLPSGPTSYPLIGNLFNVDFSSFLDEMRALRNRYGDVYSIMFSYKVCNISSYFNTITTEIGTIYSKIAFTILWYDWFSGIIYIYERFWFRKKMGEKLKFFFSIKSMHLIFKQTAWNRLEIWSKWL